LDKYSLKILELFREEEQISVGLRVRGPYDPMVRNPKVTIVFDNGKETRRIPVVVQAYFPDETMENFTIFAKYDYFLKYLFYSSPLNQVLEFWFEISYGDDQIERIPFTISGDVKLDEEELYDVEVSKGNDSFIWKLRTELIEEKKVPVVVTLIQDFFGTIWGLVLILISILFIPIFFIESILVVLGCFAPAPKNDKRGLFYLINHVRWRINLLVRKNFGIVDSKIKLLTIAFKLASLHKIKQNRVVFISNRRDDLTGNFEYVYNILKQDKSLDIRFILDSLEIRQMSSWHVWLYGRYLASSKVILVDDYISLVFQLPRRQGTNMFQLWHACGAFKTFGYSRIGKPGGQKQSNVAHRIYDGAIVSSKEIARCYAEGFGISDDKVVATGIPRTDIFFSKEYREKVQTAFYEKYPQLKGKKILLFAPTFRGNGKRSGYYPVDKFDCKRLYEHMKGEYAIIIKHHPFVPDRCEIPEEYKDYIIDMSDNSELNDLLFVTDLLVSDYSSVIFEAALLNIPMLFFAYDLQRYISTRGFYYEYEEFVPGKIVRSFGQVLTAMEEEDFETEKIHKFKTRFFDDLDGQSSQRVADWIHNTLKK